MDNIDDHIRIKDGIISKNNDSVGLSPVWYKGSGGGNHEDLHMSHDLKYAYFS